MNYSLFPSKQPVEDVVATSINVALDEIYWTNVMTTGMVEVRLAGAGGIQSVTVCHMPQIYARPLLELLFRRYALAVVLYYEKELEIEPRNWWVVLAQNLLYLELVWNRLERECTAVPGMGPNWRSIDFNHFIATEVIVRRHEPVHVYLHRRKRSRNAQNIIQVAPEELSEWFVSRTLSIMMPMSHRLE